MKDQKKDFVPETLDYEEPLLLDAEDLQNVAGGCDHACANGDCGPLPQ